MAPAQPDFVLSLFTFSKKYFFLLLLSSLATSCSQRNLEPEIEDGGPLEPVELSHIEDAKPQQEEWARYGNHSPYYVLGESYEVMESNANFTQEGIASWYGTKFHGELTSTREEYDMYAMTGAHKTLPLPSYVRVTNLENQKQVVIKVNDRGPFKEGRIIDLSYAAAHRIDMHEKGTAKVFIETLPPFLSKPKPEEPIKSKVVLSKLDFPLNKTNYLQIGVYANPETANNLQLSLVRHIKNNILVVREKMGDSQLYKVRIGPISSFEELESIQETLISRNLPHYFLISE